jgi:hypothetical protein
MANLKRDENVKDSCTPCARVHSKSRGLRWDGDNLGSGGEIKITVIEADGRVNYMNLAQALANIQRFDARGRKRISEGMQRLIARVCDDQMIEANAVTG